MRRSGTICFTSGLESGGMPVAAGDRHAKFISTPPTGWSGVYAHQILLIEEFHRVGRGLFF